MRHALVMNHTTKVGGPTRRKALEFTKRQLERTGKYSVEELKARFRDLEPVTPLPGTEYLLYTFEDLNATRQYNPLPRGGMLPAAISYQELKAYVELLDQQLEPWEVQTIKLLDNVYLEETYKNIERRQK